MKVSNKKTTFMAAVVIAGSMALMSGCGAADQPETGNAETASVMQEESSAAVPEGTGEEVQAETETVSTMQTETALETETETVMETETETDTAAKVETEPQIEEKAEAESESSAQEQTPAVQEAAPQAEGSVSESDFAVVVKGVTIPIKGDMSVYTPQLGEPDEFGSAKSCVEAGDDKVYTYGGAVIYTYITNGVDVISLIEITGGEPLPSGIHIGSTKAEVIAAYGSSYTEEGTELLYELGNKTIGLQMSGDAVSFIELF